MRNGKAKAVQCVEDGEGEPKTKALDAFETSPAASQGDFLNSLGTQQSKPPMLKGPDRLTVAKQLTDTVSLPAGCDEDTKVQLCDDAVALYVALEPNDAIKSTLSRLLVGATNLSMESMGRAANEKQSPEARAIEIRSAHKGTQMVLEIVKALHQRDGRGQQNVNVRQVRVEAGGNAIVGNVTSRDPRASVEPSSSDDDEE